MKKRYAILLATLALLCVLALLSACQKEPGNPSESNTVPGDGTGTSATTETDSREEGSDTVPEGAVPETVPETEPETETETVIETETETETETEPETEYDITQPEVVCEMNQSYYNVKDYGAVGDGLTDD
ncbi:MAG: hypothetical protein ACI4WV_00945, partial [Eubacteriales bacterium]